MKQIPVTSYFRQGFSLTQKSIDLFLIMLSLSVLTSLSYYIHHPAFKTFFTLSDIIAMVISFSFHLSLPVFLTQRQLGKELKYGEMVKLVLKNTKRIILPSILLFFLPGMLVFFLLIFVHPSSEDIKRFFQSITQGGPSIFLILVLVPMYFTEFTSFFFSLENEGLLHSIKKSIVVSFKNLPFVGIIISIGTLSYSINSFIPFTPIWVQLVKSAISYYALFVIAASALFYYQQVIKKGAQKS